MSPCDFNKKIFFIVGCGRSGTTLLKSILSSHPVIYLPPETFFYSSIVKRYNALQSRSNRQLNKIDYILKRWWIKDAGVTRERLNVVLTDNEKLTADWDAIFLALLATLSEGKHAEFVGEKTPSHIDVADKLLATFSSCKIIHIVRDPRAVLNSYRSVKVGTNQPAAVIEEWSGAVRMHQKIKENDRYHCLRYEDLISAPEEQLSNICDFLGTVYDPVMMQFHQRNNSGFAVEQKHHAKTLTPIFTSSIDSWKATLRKRHVAMIEEKLGEVMEGFGYERLGYNVSFNQGSFMMSSLMDKIHRYLVRRNLQAIKSVRANRRLRRAGNA